MANLINGLQTTAAVGLPLNNSTIFQTESLEGAKIKKA
ncbi:hypothetical protein ADIS_4225 [Lunatimonas lonarensis]|uniref:Uncharacterized protein n=1 Tax=Lunatimonas lonarensis TaxID=1232681 RepID=R7ZMK9_9BACT|nr:hypothetical protein ADIS_4225 [Lunatimonas lonarensis]